MNNTEQKPLLVTKYTPVYQVLPPRFFVPCSECIKKRARPILELEMFNLHMLICVIPVLWNNKYKWCNDKCFWH